MERHSYRVPGPRPTYRRKVKTIVFNNASGSLCHYDVDIELPVEGCAEYIKCQGYTPKEFIIVKDGRRGTASRLFRQRSEWHEC